jgi:PKD repeat protein
MLNKGGQKMRSSAKQRFGRTAQLVRVTGVVLLILTSSQLSLADPFTGDHLWNLRENADDRFHSNEAWLRPWRYNYDDGWGRWVGNYSYHLQWGSTSTIGNSDGSFTVSRSRDHQFHAWTYAYCQNAKTIQLSGGGDCVPRVFLNLLFDAPMQFPASLSLASGWNRIDITGYNQNDSYTFNCGALANLVDLMNTTEIALNQSPTANAGGPYVGTEGISLGFDASGSTDPDGDALSYRWDFNGDGTWDTGWSNNPTAFYTWLDEWSGTARVEVSDGELSDIDSTTVTIENAIPEVDAGADQDANEGEVVNFTGSFTDSGSADVHTIHWNFGDGNTALGTLTPVHVYGDNGVYTVTLTITDNSTADGNDTVTVAVSNLDPNVIIDAVDQPDPRFILPHHWLIFTGSFSDPGWLDTHTFTWDFNDGTTIQGIPAEEHDPPDATGATQVVHAYAQPGTYNVTLTITDDDSGVGISVPRAISVLGVRQAVQVLDDYIQGLPDGAFRKPVKQRRNTLHRQLTEVGQLIDNEQYQEAIDLLSDAIRAKADGYVDGNPRDDWITDTEAQQEICDMIDDIVESLLF